MPAYTWVRMAAGIQSVRGEIQRGRCEADSSSMTRSTIPRRRTASHGPDLLCGQPIGGKGFPLYVATAMSVRRREGIPALRPTRSRSGGEQLLQFARLVQLADDIGAADELALDVELGNRGPVGEVLDALADLRILEHVDRMEFLHAAGLQDLNDAGGEPALRNLRRALHEEHHRVRLDLLLDALLNVHVYS